MSPFLAPSWPLHEISDSPDAVAPGELPQARLTILYRSTDRRCRAGAPVKNLTHSASFHSREKIAPSKPGIKHLKIIPRSRSWLSMDRRRAAEDKGEVAEGHAKRSPLLKVWKYPAGLGRGCRCFRWRQVADSWQTHSAVGNRRASTLECTAIPTS